MLAIMAAAYGDDSWRAADVYNTLGVLLLEKGEFEEAVWAFRRALDIREKCAGCNEGDLALSLYNLAIALSEKGKWDDAEPLHRRALSIRERVQPGSPELALSLSGLAAVLWHKEDHVGAVTLFRRSIEILESAVGPDDPNITAVMSRLGQLLTQTDFGTNEE